MLQAATGSKGTGKRANIKGYSVGGKTGTLHKTNSAGLPRQSLYVGILGCPYDQPRLVTVVVIDEPSVGGYFGGVVAAPVFSQVTGTAAFDASGSRSDEANGSLVERPASSLRRVMMSLAKKCYMPLSDLLMGDG